MAIAPDPSASAQSQAADLGGDSTLFCDINITPFTDVILVLLIIFMVSSSAMVDAAREGRLDVQLPQAGHATVGDPPIAPLVIGLAADGRLFAQGKFVQQEELLPLLKEAFAAAPQTQVIVDADGVLPHSRVVAVIDQVREAGFLVVGIGAEGER